MAYELDDQGLRIVGYNQPIQFYDNDRVLQAEIFLKDNNTLNIGGLVTGGGSSEGEVGITELVANGTYVRLDGKNGASWTPDGGTQELDGNLNLSASAAELRIEGEHALSLEDEYGNPTNIITGNNNAKGYSRYSIISGEGAGEPDSYYDTIGEWMIALGQGSGRSQVGDDDIYIGEDAGSYPNAGSNNIGIGYDMGPANPEQELSITMGYDHDQASHSYDFALGTESPPLLYGKTRGDYLAVAGSLELWGDDSLGAEVLSDSSFDTGTPWTVSSGCSITGGQMQFDPNDASSSGWGTLEQLSTDFNTALVGDTWYQLKVIGHYLSYNDWIQVYLSSDITGQTYYLPSKNGFTVYFKTTSSPGDFTVSFFSWVTHVGEDPLIWSSISLKQITGATDADLLLPFGHTIVGTGEDDDYDLLEVNVTGTPALAWDESADVFTLSKGLSITGDLDVTGTVTGYVKTDGTTPLTADWAAGGYKITAGQFESDIATGTAPLIVASETLVNNLNADLLDGYEASEFGVLAESETVTGQWTFNDDVDIIGTLSVEHSSGDVLSLYHDGTDARLYTNDGFFRFLSIEAANASTYLDVQGNGTGIGFLRLYDEDKAEYLYAYATGGHAVIDTEGSSPGRLILAPSAHSDVSLFENSSSGQTEELQIYGYRTGDIRRSLEIGVGVDADDTASFDGVSNYFFDGKLGIEGMPDTTLHVYGDATIEAGTSANPLYVSRTDTGEAARFAYIGWRAWTIELTTSTLRFRDESGANDILTLNTSGDVGIETTSPSAQLHVDQPSTTGAQPVLTLDQADVSEQAILISYDSADVDMNIIELDVTGSPTFGWDESEDVFTLNKGLGITGDINLDGDLNFVGAQSITTTSGNLTLDAGTGGVIFLQNSDIYISNASTIHYRDSGGSGRRMILLSNTNRTYLGPIDSGWGVYYGHTYVSASGNVIEFRVDGYTGSFDNIINIDASGLEFQGARSITTTSGDLTFDPTGYAIITGDFKLEGDNYNLIETDFSDDEIWIANNASAKLGFYAATPIVQPTTSVSEAAFVENSGGTAVNDDSTFGGYTLQQIAQALQSLGLLA